METILTVVTTCVTLLLGMYAKKNNWLNINLIPIQNVMIGLIVAIIEWIITKNFCFAIATSGLVAGGVYDIFHNLAKIKMGVNDD